MKIALLRATTALAFASLASCGGDSGGGSPTPPPVSTAPKFTSSSTASVTENVATAFYDVTASDPQGDPIAFAISGGADAGAFVLSQGALRFNIAPNYDLPSDADRNNVYEVDIRATAGGETTVLALKVNVTNSREGIVVSRVADSLGEIVGASFVHNSDKMFVATADNRILTIDLKTGAVSENEFVRDNIKPGRILALAWGFPDYYYQEGIYVLRMAIDGLYVDVYSLGTGATKSSRLGDATDEPVQASMIMQGSMFIAVGDLNNSVAQNADTPYGKLLEIPQYCVYCFASIPMAPVTPQARIIGDGVRQPGGFTPASDFLYLADQGGSREHDLSIFRPEWRPLDFGWPFYEGSQPTGSNPPAAIVGPTVVYPYGTNRREGLGIVAGLLNDSSFFEELGNNYVFADRNGTVWSIPVPVLRDGFRHGVWDLEDRTEDFVPDEGSLDTPVAFIAGSGADFYIVDADGEVFRVSGG